MLALLLKLFFFCFGMASGTSEPSKLCGRLGNSDILVKSRFLALDSVFIDFRRIWLALGYLLAGKVFKHEVLKSCMKIVSFFSLFFVISGRFLVPLGGPREGFPGIPPRPFSSQGAPRDPRGVPRAIFLQLVEDFREFRITCQLSFCR